jgi:hypothetical protein
LAAGSKENKMKIILSPQAAFKTTTVSVDGLTITVDGVDYTPTSSFNSYATGFNTAITLVDKVAYLGGAETALIAIQAQGLALDIAGAVAVTTLNTLVLPAAGMNSGSYSDLNSLLLYNGLQ